MDIVDCMLQSCITAYCAFSRILKILDLYGLMENLSRWQKLNFAVNSKALPSQLKENHSWHFLIKDWKTFGMAALLFRRSWSSKKMKLLLTLFPMVPVLYILAWCDVTIVSARFSADLTNFFVLPCICKCLRAQSLCWVLSAKNLDLLIILLLLTVRDISLNRVGTRPRQVWNSICSRSAMPIQVSGYL